MEYTRQSAMDGYIFLDWFAIPQITARAEGVNEENTRSDAALAVQSIPFYVEASNIFMALVPEVKRSDTGRYCNYTSWLTRGWCRAELWCHLLSAKPFTQVIVVYSTKESQFMYPRQWQENTIDKGDFTVESDRAMVVKLGEMAVEHKLQNLSDGGPLSLYRFFLAMRPMMLGKPALTWEVDAFLQHFKFDDLQATIRDQSSMNALLCATFSGDVAMVKFLAEQRADPMSRLYGLGDLGYEDDMTLLMAALETRQSPEMIRTLLELKLDPNACSVDGITVAGCAKSPEQLRELLHFKSDIHTAVEPLGMTPLSRMASRADIETTLEMLRLSCDPNPKTFGLGVSPLVAAVSLSRGNPLGVEVIRTLLEHRADPNKACRQTGTVFTSVVVIGRVKVALLGRQACSPQTRAAATLPGETPLLAAANIGSEEAVQLLLSYGAEPVPNDRGETCEFLAEANGHYNDFSC
eukprot:symbB.v1.2.022058.t1/scaffold1941.1/size95522/4